MIDRTLPRTPGLSVDDLARGLAGAAVLNPHSAATTEEQP